MAVHFPALPEQMIDRALTMTTVEYAKTCASRECAKPPGQVFDVIKKA
ncbi:hypothetical protein ACFPES_23385 [Paenibacillus sp. GCM10023248]|nr:MULTISPECIES: hypothetical protein [Bacillales]MDD9270004.1 hypothetical protein [Paenibacillus sp. MAHUQ-63]MDR6880137.1 hypothetical protein [Bacillus sp. 3255]